MVCNGYPLVNLDNKHWRTDPVGMDLTISICTIFYDTLYTMIYHILWNRYGEISSWNGSIILQMIFYDLNHLLWISWIMWIEPRLETS